MLVVFVELLVIVRRESAILPSFVSDKKNPSTIALNKTVFAVFDTHLDLVVRLLPMQCIVLTTADFHHPSGRLFDARKDFNMIDRSVLHNCKDKM